MSQDSKVNETCTEKERFKEGEIGKMSYRCLSGCHFALFVLQGPAPLLPPAPLGSLLKRCVKKRGKTYSIAESLIC